MTALVNELRRKFKTPQAAMQALGLDEKLLANDSMENITMTDKSVSPKRKAAADALTAYLVAQGIDAKLAADEKFNTGLAAAFMAFDAEKDEDEDDKKDKKAEDDFPEKKPDCDAKDKKAKDMKAKDKKAKDEEAEAVDAEEDDEDEKKEKKADDMKAKDKKAMDEEGVKKAMDEAIAGERKRAAAIREAERFVRPWIGDLKIAYDSIGDETDIFKSVLEARGKATKGIHPSAYRAILEMLPKPGNDRAAAHNNRVAMDAAQTKSFGEFYPGAMNIKLSA